eukprot:950117-Alexandrium_andersonii.AAC.1
MSASLVGSEMCIRDSSSARPWMRHGLWLLGHFPLSSGLGLARCLPCDTCLLYTSDAADDM